jgi:hypothetical protein
MMASGSPTSRVLGAVFARTFRCAVLMAVAACARQSSPQPATTTGVVAAADKSAQKCPKVAFAGTVGVPQRRHVRGDETTPEIARRAREILDGNRDAAFGTEVPFDVDGQGYIGRIEEHCHEPGGPRKPWGRHRGVTVYHAD